MHLSLSSTVYIKSGDDLKIFLENIELVLDVG